MSAETRLGATKELKNKQNKTIMKITKILSLSAIVVAAVGLASCADTDAQYTIPTVDAPVLVSTTPTNQTSIAESGDVTLKVKYDKKIFFSSQDYTKLSFTGGTLKSASVIGSDSTLTVNVNIPDHGVACSLSIPEGVVTGPNSMPAVAVSFSFNNKALSSAPVAGTSTKAIALYNYLLNNYETNILSGMMADVAWNNDNAEQVYQWTGKYPAINGYDYIHLAASWSGVNWINYADITPVKEYADANGIACISWHWLVPTKQVYVNAPEGTSIWSGGPVSIGNWDAGLSLQGDNASVFSDVKEGDILTAVFDVDYEYGQSHSQEWYQIQFHSEGCGNIGGDAIDVNGKTEYSVTLDADAAASLKSSGLYLGGHAIKITGVKLASAPDGVAYSSLDVNSDLSYSKGTFSLTNAVTEGTWEYDVVQQDLARVATYLKLLKAADIPVLWRPLHEASGGWFWWGTDAASYKKLWQMMFNYFKTEGLDNLIWVWTSEGKDSSWYPGEEYVDIVGRDLYGKTAAQCAEEYNNLRCTYNKIITLSECGYGDKTKTNAKTGESYTEGEIIDNISDQWSAGAKWSWFMPWYDGTDDKGNPVIHSDVTWWTKVMNMSNVITRDKVNLK